MYSPKIREALIPKIYKLAQKNKKPMTYIVNETLTKYLESYEGEKGDAENFRSRSI